MSSASKTQWWDRSRIHIPIPKVGLRLKNNLWLESSKTLSGSPDFYSLGSLWLQQTCLSLFYLCGHSFLFLMDNTYLHLDSSILLQNDFFLSYLYCLQSNMPEFLLRWLTVSKLISLSSDCLVMPWCSFHNMISHFLQNENFPDLQVISLFSHFNIKSKKKPGCTFNILLSSYLANNNFCHKRVF